MKKRDRFEKHNYTVGGNLAVYCHDNIQREILRRFSMAPENLEMLRCHALVEMSKGQPDEALAERFAKAGAASTKTAADICDEVLAEVRAIEEAEDEERRVDRGGGEP